MFLILHIFSTVYKPYVDKDENEVPGIVSFHFNRLHYIRCDYCCKYPHIVKQYVPKKSPAITTDQGTKFLSNVLKEHLDSKYHKECAKSHRISSAEVETAAAPMEIAISKANKSQIDNIGRLMIPVFLDGKRLNLPPHTWPSRQVAAEASYAYDSSNQSKSIIPENINLQYVNKPGHLELTTSIVQSYRETILRKINECVTISLRIDGSIDFTHVDKIYVMGKLINKDGSSELVFFGIGEQTERYATGLMAAVKEALKFAVEDPKIILRKVSSVVTDGTNMNIGEKNGLWALLEKEIKLAGSDIPLLKVWCAAHRSELAWKSVSKSVPEVSKILNVLSRMSSHFHSSPMRTRELQKIAKDKDLRLLMLPKIFEVRWSQFTFALLRSVLVSWQALIIYFQRNADDSECAGFLKYLIQLENLELIAVLADVLFAFSRLQKKFQSDQLTLISMKSHTDSMLTTLNSMQNHKIPGGCESKLAIQLVHDEDEDKKFFKSIELKFGSTTRRAAINVADVRTSILDALQHFLTERFEIDKNLLEKIIPFISFDKSVNVEEIHSLLAPDISLPNLYLQFNDFANSEHPIKDMNLNDQLLTLAKTVESRNAYAELITVFGRIRACTPHSSDVERLISANNRLKTKLRANMSIETENKYMFIHTNMPNLADWNPTLAAKIFLDEKNRRNRDTTPQSETTRRQVVFKGVFSEARTCNDNDDDEDDESDEGNDGRAIFDF